LLYTCTYYDITQTDTKAIINTKSSPGANVQCIKGKFSHNLTNTGEQKLIFSFNRDQNSAKIIENNVSRASMPYALDTTKTGWYD
jgi:oxalate decarboxylase/phosphoglucose isomerase-like protein (cupin superfamily)